MTAAEKKCWKELAGEMPWLNASHRILLRLTCHHAARLEGDGDLGVSASQALSSLLSKLGATPVDESRISYADDDEGDNDSRWFGPPN